MQRYACSKISYRSRGEANSAIRIMIGLGREKRPKKSTKLETYLCPACQLWHIGHPVRTLPLTWRQYRRTLLMEMSEAEV
jgi:hypothetical protein